MEDGTEKAPEALSKARDSNWPAVLFFIHIHLLSVYGIWLLFFEAHWLTVFSFITLTMGAILGVTTGAHRLWAHRSYTANTGLRVALMLLQTMAGQGPIYDWVQQHRLHHAHFATEDDPFDYNKGFLYAHMMTRLRKLSPHQLKLRDAIDMTDLENDSVVMFQKRAYWLMYVIMFLLLPLNAPLEYWDDTVLSAVFVLGFLRYGVILHAAWLIESAVCIWGLKPGEKYPSDSNAVFIINKTFWPHYHYLVPYDYKTGEYGTYDSGCSTAFIRVFAALRIATDLRTVEQNTIHIALAEAAKKKRPIQEALSDAVQAQKLSDDHFLKRG